MAALPWACLFTESVPTTPIHPARRDPQAEDRSTVSGIIRIGRLTAQVTGETASADRAPLASDAQAVHPASSAPPAGSSQTQPGRPDASWNQSRVLERR